MTVVDLAPERLIERFEDCAAPRDYFRRGCNARRRKREMDALAALVPSVGKGHKRRSTSAGTIPEPRGAEVHVAIFEKLIEEKVRKMVEKRVPSLRETIKHSTYQSGHDMAMAVPWEVRKAVQAVHSSDSKIVEEMWGSVARMGTETPAWWDRDAVSETESYPRGTMKVTRKDLCTLSPQSWLNDEIINMYMMLLVTRSRELPDTYPAIHAVSSHWLTKLLSSKQGDGYNYGAVKRWTRSVDVFSKQILLIPVNWGGSHWTFAYIHFPLKKIVYCDSLSSLSAGRTVTSALKRWLCDEHRERKKIENDWEEMRLYPAGDIHIPQQNNSYDCGVFTCSFANCVAAGRPFTFSQQDMKYLRKRIVIELLEARVPTPL